MMAPSGLAPSKIYPAVRRFLVESGLTRTLKAFDKETSLGEDAPAASGTGRKAAALAQLELTQACKCWLDMQLNKADSPREVVAEAEPPRETPLEAHVAVEPRKKRRREQIEAVEEVVEEPAVAASAAAPQEATTGDLPEKKKKKKKKQDEGEDEEEKKQSSVPFKRVDDEKWRSMIKDSRLLDNTHTAKQKFGGSVGDTWADKASTDLLAVKGKGFRKEMAKKKRASWRGGGSLDMGVNSIKFSDSSDEE